LEKIREQLQVLKERAILVGAYTRDRQVDIDKIDPLIELTCLAETAGAIVAGRIQQRLNRIHPGTYIGSGKALEIAEKVEMHKADVVIFDNDLSPGQIRELEKIVKAKVLDRSELILDIFATRAQTKQAKLQVELAQLEYTYPRLTRMWSHLDTVTAAGGSVGGVGGIGTRGTGEKQLEIDRRLVSKRITELKRELKTIDRRKLREIDGRKEFYTICIVGYTNAGKSTLMNALTEANVYVEDKLFATLDTRTRKWQADNGVEVLLSDTVGFVSNLPHHLVASFKATLEEALSADLLLHVVDASSPFVFDQIKSVEQVLNDIGCADKQVLTLLNKSDTIHNLQIFETLQTVHHDAIAISAKTKMNLDKLAAAVADKVRGGKVRLHFNISPAEGKLISFLRANAYQLTEQYNGDRVDIEATLGRNQLIYLHKLGGQNYEILH
jgi:GTP-binding protein HflX